MPQTCSNCLNAYNSPHDADVHCVNREWIRQHRPHIRTTVACDEPCGTWQRRNDTQKPLVFSQPVQLGLFEDNEFL